MKSLTPIDLLEELLQFRSITPNDDGALNYISIFLGSFDEQRIDKNGVKNIFLKKKYGDGDHICFAGHIDVVPPGDGWSSDPFLPIKKDNFIYARGAQDMKSGVAAMMCALHDAKFDGTLSLLLTSDEEGDGIFGTQEVLKHLSEIGELPDFAIVAEPTCETTMGDFIKIGRRGSINGILRIKGIQGHAAYPNKCLNPVHLLAKKITNFADYEFDNGGEFFEPSKIIITDIRGGIEAVNITPAMVKVMFNVRNSNLTTEFDVRNYVEGLFEGDDFILELKSSSKPFITNGSSKIVSKLTQSIEKICQIKPILVTSGGTSDARYFKQFGVDVVEFGVINDRIHAIDERVGIDEVEKLYAVFVNLIETFNEI